MNLSDLVKMSIDDLRKIVPNNLEDMRILHCAVWMKERNLRS